MPRYTLRLGNQRVPLASTDTALSEAIGKRLASSTPQTNVDSTGGGHGYQFNGQDLTFDDLRDIKDIRDSGGQVAQLMDYKALLNFGEGAEVHVEADGEDEELPTELIDGEELTLQEWLETEAFPRLDLQVLDLGGDALWYPCAVGEIRETVTGGFKEALPAQPWTIIPVTDDQGEVIAYQQKTKAASGGYTENALPADDLWHIVVNKASARDQTGISEVLRNKDEIQAFKENEAAINNAIELHGFPQRHIKVGKEDGAPVRDDDLRRVRTIFDPRTSDANTAYFTGQDVDVDTLESQNFDFGAIHEMDMRNLTTALGLPLEAGNVGADGLGSGKPAELRFALLKLAIKANQRSFGVQFVERVMRPVIRDYSPFDHNATITLDIQDPLEDIGEVAELIQSIGDYMTNEEIRSKLDMPAPEDEEIAEGYRSPADIEAPEDEGGPFGGDGGLFRDGADGRTLQEIPDNAVSISDRSEAPEGAQIITGPGGGLYYVPGAGDSDEESGTGGAGTVDSPNKERMSELAQSVDKPDNPEQAREMQSELFDELGEEYGRSEVIQGRGTTEDGTRKFTMDSAFQGWESAGYWSSDVAPVWFAAQEATGRDAPMPEGMDEEDPAVVTRENYVDGTEDAIQDVIAFSQEFVANNMEGDTVPVSRGINDELAQQAIGAKENGEPLEIDPRAMESWSTDSGAAEEWGEVVLQKELTPDEVAFYGPAVIPGEFDDQEITSLGVEPYEIDPDDIVVV